MWLNRLAVALAAYAAIVFAAFAQSTSDQLLEGLVNPGYEEQPAWFKNSFLDMQEDIAEAADTGKRLMLYFYQDGCPYCAKMLRENFAIKEIEDKTRAHFDVVAINIWGDREVVDLAGEDTTEKRFAADLKVMYTPTLLFLDEQGEVALRVNGYYPPHKFSVALDYAAVKQPDQASFREYYKRLDPPAAHGELHADASFLQPPHDLSNVERPLLVLFEQKSCPPCDELHMDIFKREAIQDWLDDFAIAQFDMWSKEPLTTPKGMQTTAYEWARRLNISYAPSLVFFDRDGNEVFRAETYLQAGHIRSALAYIATDAYREQPSFQRFVQDRLDEFETEGESAN